MDTDKVIQDLNRRFAAPLPEVYHRRIIFWYDEDKEFEDKLDDDWLMDMKRYSGEFRTDLIPMWMDEMELPFNFAPARAPDYFHVGKSPVINLSCRHILITIQADILFGE